MLQIMLSYSMDMSSKFKKVQMLSWPNSTQAIISSRGYTFLPDRLLTTKYQQILHVNRPTDNYMGAQF